MLCLYYLNVFVLFIRAAQPKQLYARGQELPSAHTLSRPKPAAKAHTAYGNRAQRAPVSVPLLAIRGAKIGSLPCNKVAKQCVHHARTHANTPHHERHKGAGKNKLSDNQDGEALQISPWRLAQRLRQRGKRPHRRASFHHGKPMKQQIRRQHHVDRWCQHMRSRADGEHLHHMKRHTVVLRLIATVARLIIIERRNNLFQPRMSTARHRHPRTHPRDEERQQYGNEKIAISHLPAKVAQRNDMAKENISFLCIGA